MFKGKKYVDSQKLLEKSKLYDGAEAMNLVCQTSKAKFDETIEVHLRLGVDSRHADQQVQRRYRSSSTVQVRRFAFSFSLRATRLQLLKKQALNM